MLIVLFLQHRGFRYVEALVIALICLIAGSFAIELWLSRPTLTGVAAGFMPRAEILRDPSMLYIAIGILGATVMPHNLYLHSSIVQTRKYLDTTESRREAIRFASIDSVVALMFALFINAAILIMAAATFHGTGHQDVAEIGDAYQLLSPLLGTAIASILFAVALLCSGQNATLTGTLAGQIVMEGFINLRMRPWLRRLITRLIAIVPAIIVIALYGERGTGPLHHPEPGDPQPAAAFRRLSAGHVHGRSSQDGAVREPAVGQDRWRGPLRLSSLLLNVYLLYQIVHRNVAARGESRLSECSWHFHRGPRGAIGIDAVTVWPRSSRRHGVMYKRILVAVENSAADRTILAHAIELAEFTGAELLLVHVADGWAARNFDQLKLRESEEMKSDRAYLDRLRGDLTARGLTVDTMLAMGDPATELIRAAEEQHVDLIAMSTHGHRFFADLIHGTTADRVGIS